MKDPGTAVRIGVINVSDRASAGEYEDTPGQSCVALLRQWLSTTGGTGPAPRDVTPEATAAVCTRLLPGFGEQMRAASLAFVPTAILSRQTAGIRGRTLIVNLPGRPKAIRENLEAVFPAIPYCLDLIGAPRLEANPAVMRVFRPA
jgi:molybdopterin adenylyltransferase